MRAFSYANPGLPPLFNLLAAGPTYSAEYTAYANRVSAASGDILDPAVTQKILDYKNANTTLGILQWCDGRAGLNFKDRWFSLISAATDAVSTIYSNNSYRADAQQGRVLTGAYNAGTLPTLQVSDCYTVGLYLNEVKAGAYWWGNRYGQLNGSNGWTFLSSAFFRIYNYNTDNTCTPTIPNNVWKWVWMVKDGATVTFYDEANTTLASMTISVDMANQEIGVGGGTLSDGQQTALYDLSYRTFIRATTALTAAQRAAIQAI
jgi:hypothetical protein